MAAGRRARFPPGTADLTAPRSPLQGVSLYLIASLPGTKLDERALSSLAAAARGGVGAIQLRMKDADTDQRRRALQRARAAIPASVLLLINDDLDAVFDARGRPLADGVHLGRDDAEGLAPAELSPDADRRTLRRAGLRVARERLGPERALGTSTREAWEVELALEAGADHMGFGAIAPSTSKAHTKPASLDTLQRLLAQHTDVPLFPIGGLTPPRLEQLAELGARRAALGATVLESSDPERAARRCLSALGAT
ncbi:MAG: hypothetical protein DHS20C15_34290 [Planctomycetota bacterium]|nr:MAG: hypothetical protein DHS20C15_34290 [Planctomycetota bacterium]